MTEVTSIASLVCHPNDIAAHLNTFGVFYLPQAYLAVERALYTSVLTRLLCYAYNCSGLTQTNACLFLCSLTELGFPFLLCFSPFLFYFLYSPSPLLSVASLTRLRSQVSPLSGGETATWPATLPPPPPPPHSPQAGFGAQRSSGPWVGEGGRGETAEPASQSVSQPVSQ